MQMPLTDIQVRTAKPRERAYKLPDGGGLYLFLPPTGARLWRLRFTLHGKDRTLALGDYPTLSLKDARAEALVARQKLHRGVDPVQAKREAKASAARNAEGTFGALSDRWRENRAWTAPTRKQYDRLFERDILPPLGRRPVANIQVSEIRAVLEKAAKPRLDLDSEGKRKKIGGVISARHVKLLISGVLDLAVEDGLCAVNVARIRGVANRSKSRTEAHTATPYRHLSADGLRTLLMRLDTYQGEPTTTAALRLLMLCFTRPSELREAKWSEFDIDAVGGGIWRIPAERMKGRRPHDVPLSSQAIEALRELRPYTGTGEFLFPNERDSHRPMGRSTLQRALGYLGMESSPHGFRHTASTLLHEQGFDSLVIERQLAHIDSNPVRAAYNKATYLPERRRMLQQWADWLDALKAGEFGGKVVQMRARA
jgi:integrase